MLVSLLLLSSAYALEELIIKDMTYYDFVGVRTFKINETIIGYEVILENVTYTDYDCLSDPCVLFDFVKEVESLEPIIDGSSYSVIEKENREEIIVNKFFDSEIKINLEQRTSSIKNNVLTIKDLSDGACWGDARPDDCYHPKIPCKQFDLLTGEIILEVSQ